MKLLHGADAPPVRSRPALERRLEEREEVIRLKEAFLAGISHELRTPLNAIIGYPVGATSF